MSKELLEVRKEKKKKQPEFVRQDAHKHKGGRIRWRRPRGLQSKVRLQVRGYKRKVKEGYRVPKAVRGTDPTGKPIVYVASVKDIESVKKDEAVMIQRVGMKRKKEIVEAALKKGITLLNGDQSFVDKVNDQMKQRKERRDKMTKAAKEKEDKKEKKKLAEKVEKVESEDQKKKEKQEKEKVLTKRT